MFCLLLSFFLLLAASKCNSAITSHPQSVNATINSTVEFSCNGTGDYTVWIINNKIISHNEEANYHINSYNSGQFSQLIIYNATADLNNSTVICRHGNFPNLAESESALLLLQGYLEAPKINASFSSNTTLTVQWEAPYSLENIPILGYNISIVDFVTGASTLKYYSNTSRDDSFHWLNDKHCYEIRLTANNSLGKGNTAITYINESVTLPDSINYTVTSTGSTTQISVTLQIEINCFPLTANLSLKAAPDDNSDIETVTTTVSNSEAIQIKFSKVAPNRVYPLTLTLYNSTTGWTAESPSATNISTFDVQRLERGERNGMHCIRCLFTMNSEASGCLIHIYTDSNISNTPLKHFMSLINYNETVSKWNCYNKEVTNSSLYIVVYDIERYGKTSSDPAIALYDLQLPSISISPATSTQSASSSYITMATISQHSTAKGPVTMATITPSSGPITMATITPSSVVISSCLQTVYITFSKTDNTPSSSVSINSLPPTVSGARTGNTGSVVLIPLIVAMAVVFIIVLIGMVVISIALCTKIKNQKALLISLQKTVVPNTYNPIYDRSGSVSANQTAIDKLSEEIEKPPVINTGTHIYSEVNINTQQQVASNGVSANGEGNVSQWVPNPSYGQTGCLLSNGGGGEGTGGAGGDGNEKIYDSPKKQSLDAVPELNPCPAYDQPPLLPARVNK